MVRKRARFFLAVAAAVILLISACSSPTDKEGTFIPENLERREEILYKQYLVNGRRNYLVNCSNCHGKDGEGIGKLYPPLAQSDYLLQNTDKLACIIKYGQKGEIVVNGVMYNMEMPAQAHLSDIEIAEIITYVANSWKNQTGFVSVKEVRQQLAKCDGFTQK